MTLWNPKILNKEIQYFFFITVDFHQLYGLETRKKLLLKVYVMINCAFVFKYNSIVCKLWQWDDWFLFICSWRKLLTDHFHTKIRNSLVHRFALSELYGRHSSWLIHLSQSSSCLVQRLVCISRHRRWSLRPNSLTYFGPHSSFLAFFWTRAQNHSQFDCWARLYLWQLLWIENKQIDGKS